MWTILLASIIISQIEFHLDPNGISLYLKLNFYNIQDSFIRYSCSPKGSYLNIIQSITDL